MIERRKIAWVLLALGAVLAVIGSIQDVFSTVYKGFGADLRSTSTLWVTTSNPQDGAVEQTALFAAGWPVVVAAIMMAVAVVLLTRQETAFAGRPLAVGGAGVLAGILFLYVFQLRELKELIDSEPPRGSGKDELLYHDGFYLLLIAAAAGLVGAVLAQRRNPEPAVEDEDEGDGVVVHQLDSDDDTPPFGIAIPDDDERETR